MLQVFDFERISLRLVIPPNANALQRGIRCGLMCVQW